MATLGKYLGIFSKSVIKLNTSFCGALINQLPVRCILFLMFALYITAECLKLSRYDIPTKVREIIADDSKNNRRLKKWQRTSLGVLACGFAGFIATAPSSVSQTLTNTTVHDKSGPIPSNISFEPGKSQLDLGPLGSLYNDDLTRFNIGLEIDTTQPPSLLDYVISGENTESQQTLSQITGFYGQPDEILDSYQAAATDEVAKNFIKNEIILGLGATGLIGIVLVSSREKYKRIATASAIGVIAISSTGVAALRLNEWSNENQQPSQVYTITTFNNTVSNSSVLAAALNSWKNVYNEQVSREEGNSKLFRDTALETFNNQLNDGVIPPPSPNETMLLALSDIHSNRDMISVWTEVVKQINQMYGEKTISLLLLNGDETYGSVVEAKAVQLIAKILDSQATAGVDGNHDTKTTHSQKIKAGIEVLDCESKTIMDLKVAGCPDPNITTVSSLLTNGNDEIRNKKIPSQSKTGEALQRLNDEDNPDILISPTAYSLKSLLGMNKIDKHAMDAWFSSQTSIASTVENLASLVTYGNWHRQQTRKELHNGRRYKVVQHDDGRWSVVVELGSAGGANPEESLSKLTLPFTTPGGLATGELITINNDSHLVTKLQNINFDPDGQAEIMKVDRIFQTWRRDRDSNPG